MAMNDTPAGAGKQLLLVDDDELWLKRLARAMERRGYEVLTAGSVAEGQELLRLRAPGFAVVDLRLGDGNGLDVVEGLRARRPDARIVVLTGYGAIATAVAAVKLGAVDYLAKPVDADELDLVLSGGTGERALMPERPMSADRVRWEHIQRVFERCNRNISETARQLNMHRRTLQRILAKRSPKE
jgi:two-component system response regulator RegA